MEQKSQKLNKKIETHSWSLKSDQECPYWEGRRTYLNLSKDVELETDMIHWGKGPMQTVDKIKQEK